MPLLLVLASGKCCTTATAGQPRAERIYEWSFRQSDDLNSDLWPDGWKRRRDLRHPAYIEMQIVARDASVASQVSESRRTLVQLQHLFETGSWDPNFVPETTPRAITEFLEKTVLDNCLEIRMDGGAAEMVSPRFPMDPRFSYRVQADVRTQALDGHRVWIELDLYDSAEQLLQSLKTVDKTGTTDWETVSLYLDTPPSVDLTWGELHIQVEQDESLEISGVARIDNIYVYRTPRLQLTTSVAHNVAAPLQAITVDCLATGIKGEVSHVLFDVIDLEGRRVASEAATLEYDQTDNSAQEWVAGAKSRPHFVSKAGLERSRNGIASWTFSLASPGLYTLHAYLGNKPRLDQVRTLKFAIIDDLGEIRGGPFGWSLPAFGTLLQPSEVPELVTRFGAGWVKYPVWFDMKDITFADELIAMTERLQAFGVRCIGRIDEPPASQRMAFTESDEELHARAMFRDPQTWEPLLEPVLTRMGMRLNWFQLGRDDDLSFMGDSDDTELLSQTREKMKAYCQQLKLTTGWDWLQTDPATTGDAPWDSIHFRTTPQLTASELKRYVEAAGESSHKTWVNLELLPASEYRLRDRVRDLTERVIEIRQSGIEAAFLPHPFDSQRGIFDHQQATTEMLIPWLRLVAHVGEADYVGAINMPQGSINHVFAHERNGIMVVWNDRDTVEQQFLGANASATDIWGTPVQVENVVLPSGSSEQRLAIGAWPVLIRDVNVDVVRLRQNFRIELTHLASRLGERQDLPVSISNPFDKPLRGEVTLVSESLLGTGTVTVPLQIASLRQQALKFPIDLRRDASAGEHRLRFDFDIEADENYRFSIYRDITLGLGDIKFQWETTRRNANVVELRMDLLNNLGTTVSFDCKLFPPGMPYQRFQVSQANPGSTIRSFYLNIPESENIKECWLRCEGVGLGRVLNYRINF